MTYTVFYMNPDATPEVCKIIQEQMPAGWRLTTPSVSGGFTQELTLADFIVVATEPIREEHLACAPRLKMIQHQGVGYEKIDLAACRARGIPVGLTPEGTSVGVAEHTLLLILAVYKRLVTAMNGMAAGKWMQWSLRQHSFELAGKTLGLVGMGRIGREVARRALAFDTRVVYFDSVACADDRLRVARAHTLGELLACSDIVSLHAPETSETRHLINEATLSQMKRGAILINTARGGLVDERALIEALRKGHLGGAGLDVFETEPLPPNHPLLEFPNVIATPHISAGTRDALTAKMKAVFANLVRFASGTRPINVVPELQDMIDLFPLRGHPHAAQP
jgi:phosphoglycerate dehydrogenase-like enzyme